MKYESFGSYSRNSTILLAFHGLPGLKSDGNRDLLRKLAQEKQVFSILISYPNLSNNSFSFLDSTTEILETLSELVLKYKSNRWQVLGHSWGGLLALAALSRKIISAEQVCLLSPFTRFPQNDQVLLDGLKDLKEEYPLLFGEQKDLLSILAEVRKVEELYAPFRLAAQLPAQTSLYLMQASDDQEVLAVDSKDFLAQCYCRVRYKEIQTDHSFLENRENVFQHLVEFFCA
jgi:surfactin synthase thioesterase subunit